MSLGGHKNLVPEPLTLLSERELEAVWKTFLDHGLIDKAITYSEAERILGKELAERLRATARAKRLTTKFEVTTLPSSSGIN